MSPETRYQIKMCEGDAEAFQEVVQRAMDETELVKVLQQIAGNGGLLGIDFSIPKIRRIRTYLLDAMESIYAEQNDDKSDRADIYDRLENGDVDAEIDRRPDERAERGDL